MNQYRCSHQEDLNIFDECIKNLGNKYGVTLEIGVHEGGASKRIIDAYRTHYMGALHYHIGVDPFGSAPYTHTDRDFSENKVDYRYGDEKREIAFFDDRMDKGSFIVFDDIDKIDMKTVHAYMNHLKWKLYRSGTKKSAYVKC
jgi:hypothetical protein